MKLEEQIIRRIRQLGHAYNTEVSYVREYRKFTQFVKAKYGEYRHPEKLKAIDVQDFLTHLAVERNVAPDTQRVSLSAIKFLYREVLDVDLGKLTFAPAQGDRKLPVVMTFRETSTLLNRFSGLTRLQSELMYGCGLRISDCLRLRVKDLDFSNNTVQVNDAKGGKNRLLMMPRTVTDRLQEQLSSCRCLYELDREQDAEGVWMPHALEKKAPAWSKEWGWFWLFPASKLSKDPRADVLRRHHLGRDPYAKQMAIHKRQLGFTKEIVPHTWRHSFATHMLLQGCDLRTLQRLMGHASIKTTEIYLHVIEAMSKRLVSPLDRLQEYSSQEAEFALDDGLDIAPDGGLNEVAESF